MGIFARYSFLPEKRKWLGVVFEAAHENADPTYDTITVLTIETADSEQAIRDWIPKALELREWETRQ